MRSDRRLLGHIASGAPAAYVSDAGRVSVRPTVACQFDRSAAQGGTCVLSLGFFILRDVICLEGIKSQYIGSSDVHSYYKSEVSVPDNIHSTQETIIPIVLCALHCIICEEETKNNFGLVCVASCLSMIIQKVQTIFF